MQINKQNMKTIHFIRVHMSLKVESKTDLILLIDCTGTQILGPVLQKKEFLGCRLEVKAFAFNSF